MTDAHQVTDERGTGTAANDVGNLEFSTEFNTDLDLEEDVGKAVAIDEGEFLGHTSRVDGLGWKGALKGGS
jgi:hypothetical protein